MFNKGYVYQKKKYLLLGFHHLSGRIPVETFQEEE